MATEHHPADENTAQPRPAPARSFRQPPASLPPNTIEIRSGDGSHVRLDVPEPQPKPLTYGAVLERVHRAIVDRRLATGTFDLPARVELHPDSITDVLISSFDPATEAIDWPRLGLTIRGIVVQGDPRIPVGDVQVVWP